MDGLLHLVHKEGTGRAAAPPSPLLVYQNNSPPVNGQPITVGLLLYSGRCCAFLTYSLKAAFHYYSQLQIWSKTWSQAGRKHVESQLRTCLKRVFFSTFHLSSTRTKQRTCWGSRPGFRQKTRKLVQTVSQARKNLKKTWLQTGSKTRFAARFAASWNNGMRP